MVRALQLVLATLLTALILLEVVQVLLRYFFAGGLVWGRDVSTLALFSIAWLGAPLAWLKAQHIAVDLWPGLKLGRRTLQSAINLVALIFCGVLLTFALQAYEAFSFIELPSLGVAASVKFLPILVGTVLLAVAAFLNLVFAPDGESRDGG